MTSPIASIRSRWRRDILFRLWASIFLAMALTGGVYTAVSINSLRADAEAELNERAQRLTSILAKSLARPLFDINTLAITSVGDAIGMDPEILTLRVAAPDGTLLVSVDKKASSAGRVVSASREVVFSLNGKDFPVGRIEVSLSGVAIDSKLRGQIGQAGISGLILMLAIAASMLLVGRKITRPFADIQLALDRLARGNTDVNLSGLEREDQIGQLSRAVEHFRSTLNELRTSEQRTAILLEEKSSIADRLKAIYDGSNDAVMLLTERGFFDCNQRTLDMFGVSNKADFIACHPSNLSPQYQPDGVDSHTAAGRRIQAAFETGESRFEWMHAKMDGTTFPAEVLLSAFDYDGERVLQATVRDITKRKRIERELHDLNNDLEARIALRTSELSAMLDMLAESKKKLQGIVDTALDAVVRFDARSVIVGWNAQAEAIFGWTAQEASGLALHQTIIPPRHREAHLRGIARYIETQESNVIDHRIEISALHRDGAEFPIELAITRVMLDDPLKFEFCAFIRDITQRKQAEEEIRTSLEKQKELNQLKSRFVAMASHEFRTPLATIMSSTDLLTYYFDRMPEAERGELLQSITAAVKRMTKMLEDILVIGKSETEHAEFNPIPMQLDAFCQRLVDELQSEQESIGARRREVSLSVQDGAEQGLFDEKLMRHVFGNLLSNAVKYSPAGGAVEFRVRRNDDAFIFSVEDHGIGIPESDLPRLFESFHRAANVGTISGTGLGLAIVKRSIELHSGSISISSTEGSGTTFTVSLPMIRAPS